MNNSNNHPFVPHKRIATAADLRTKLANCELAIANEAKRATCSVALIRDKAQRRIENAKSHAAQLILMIAELDAKEAAAK